MKRKMTSAQKKAKADRQKKYEWVLMNGKQVRIKRPEMIEGMLVDDFIAENASDVWLTQNGMFDVLDARERENDGNDSGSSDESKNSDDSDVPF